MNIVYGPKWPYFSCWDYIGLFGTGFMQVFYLGRAPRTKETLPDFLKWSRVTWHPLVFRGLTGSQRTPEFGASQIQANTKLNLELQVRTQKESGVESRRKRDIAKILQI